MQEAHQQNRRLIIFYVRLRSSILHIACPDLGRAIFLLFQDSSLPIFKILIGGIKL